MGSEEMTHKALNLSHINLGQVPLAAKQHHKDAVLMAKTNGYCLDDIRPAYNRFWRFWVIGQWIDPWKKLRLLLDNGDKAEIELKNSLY